MTVYTYGNERISATTFNGYGYHFGRHDHGYHNIFTQYEKWHDRWQIKDHWHNNWHGSSNIPRGYEESYSNAEKFRATYGSYSSYHSGKYCGHNWKTIMSKIYYLYDGHGSVERVHGKDGSTFRLEYDTYGNLVAGIVERWHIWYNDIFAHKTANIYAYSGERYNVISGLQFLRARWYDTDTGRFISEDSYLGTQANPLSRNRYIYTANNPVNHIDPSGHSWETIADIISAIDSGIQLFTNPFSWENLGFFTWDVASVVIPVVPGSYAVKGLKIAGEVVDTAHDIDKARSAVETGVELAEAASDGLSKCDELAKSITQAIDTPDLLFKIDLQWFASKGDDIGEEIIEEAMGDAAEEMVEEVAEKATKEIAEETAEAAVKNSEIIGEIIDSIPSQLKQYGKCDEFAKSFVDILEKYGISYEIIRIDSVAGIYSDKARMSIGVGYHYGIKIGEMVYDNMTTG